MKLHRMLFVPATALLLAVSGCSSATKSGADIGTKLSVADYDSLIEKYTRHDKKYEGFYNIYEVYATFLNSNAQTAILQRRSDVLQWTEDTARKERERMFQENNTQTKFALSFFTPSTRLNDLHKGASIWKVYLEVNGERYEGKASRRNGKLEDIAAIFPYHNRWSVPYEVTFNVPLSAVENQPVKFILTSTQGTAVLNY